MQISKTRWFGRRYEGNICASELDQAKIQVTFFESKHETKSKGKNKRIKSTKS